MQKVLVTGSNGFIGSLLTEQLLVSSSYQVIGLGKGENRNPKLPSNSYSECDLINHVNLNKTLNEVKPDVIIHCAAISQVDLCESEPELCNTVNVEATRVVTDFCSLNRVKLIFFSSDFVFDGQTKWQSEEALPNPISEYGRSKMKAEKIVSSVLKDYSIIRPVLVYGYSPYANRSNIFTWVCHSMKNGEVINVVNDQIRTPTYVMDVVRLTLDIMEQNSSGIFNIGGGSEVSIYDFACLVKEKRDVGKQLINSANSDLVSGASLRPKFSCFSNAKLKKVFHWKPLKVEEGIQNAIEALEQDGAIN